ncbi:sigma-70 family RNA polymerase sigma factor [Corallococcus macrosporus]|uniref:RNA polymerase sigma factor n=2 Tax=Myxococcaceae TaxID=31 RepID=A0A250JSZ3_9BACT|nr:sigma-70 family RNA polymerase sigma factor [Corallococcus macrosporus]AEI61977.1 ECF subfamily RNA polymerase sigma factor [Corallococcus macrosporus]ATB46226.1 RNA polymerase sigma factor [Corallococcus macrosporus DSM 14697]
MSKRTDEQLVKAARSGDGEALDEVLTRHEKQVYRFGLRMCGSEEDAMEVLQETLLTAFRGIHAFRGDAALSTWLYQVARTHCFRLRRRRAGAPEDFQPLDMPAATQVVAQEATPDMVSHARQMGEVLQAAILALPEAYREVLILRDVEGLTAEEAARVVGVEVRALKSRLHRARLQMREHLATLMGEGAPGQHPGCPALARELAEFAEEAVDQAACSRLEDHLSRCPRCSEACDALKRTVSLCRRIPGDEVPAPVRAAVRHALVQALPT